MKICIFGAGAIGCTIAARLAPYQPDLTLIARGSSFEYIKAHGINYNGQIIKVRVTDKPENLETQDVIITSVKAYNLEDIAPTIKYLSHNNTIIAPMMNGIPWNFFLKKNIPFEDLRLKSLDPKRIIESNIDKSKVVNTVLYMSSEIISHGVVKHAAGNRIVIGDDRLKETLNEAQFKVEVSKDIRSVIWSKLLGNLAANPLSAIHRKTVEELVQDKDTFLVMKLLLKEGGAVADKIGLKVPLSLEEQIDNIKKSGSHKTSMLQDIEKGKPLEIEAIIGGVREIAGHISIDTPTINTIYEKCRSLRAN